MPIDPEISNSVGMKLATHIDAGLGKNPIEYGGYISKTEGGITMVGEVSRI